jgi:hypothetical protein
MRAALLVLFLVGCGGDDSNSPADAAADAFASKCGKPGDTGNEIGVGKFCASLQDCNGTAPLCSSLGDSETHFCTKTCSMGSAGACGTDAMCVCNSGNQCGCTPNACLN